MSLFQKQSRAQSTVKTKHTVVGVRAAVHSDDLGHGAAHGSSRGGGGSGLSLLAGGAAKHRATTKAEHVSAHVDGDAKLTEQ